MDVRLIITGEVPSEAFLATANDSANKNPKLSDEEIESLARVFLPAIEFAHTADLRNKTPDVM
ncbi:MAG: hypothetical protein LBN34_06505 [Clostridiales Family XIII bacterium]|jgi:hypothetical protein|nr:hypothetical protein [Clostridiales Family XIII bacterium]